MDNTIKISLITRILISIHMKLLMDYSETNIITPTQSRYLRQTNIQEKQREIDDKSALSLKQSHLSLRRQMFVFSASSWRSPHRPRRPHSRRHSKGRDQLPPPPTQALGQVFSRIQSQMDTADTSRLPRVVRSKGLIQAGRTCQTFFATNYGLGTYWCPRRKLTGWRD